MAIQRLQNFSQRLSEKNILKASRRGIMLSKGTIFNLGSEIKDFGERMAHVRLFGFPLFRWCCGPVIRLGYIVMDYSYNGLY